MENDPRIALITNFEYIDAGWCDVHPEVEVVASPTTGLDHIDQDELKRRGIKLVSLQGERKFLNDITSTAEHTMGLIIALSRNYRAAFKGERTLGHKLAGQTIGIVGIHGRIGRQMVSLARALKMRVWGADNGDDLLPLLKQSDIVTLHIPLAGNEGYWKPIHFELMKRSAFFINTSRSRIIEDGALLESLTKGKIAGAAVDFTDDPALVEYAKNNANLILTPHLGGFTVEDRVLTDAFILNKARKCLSQ